MEFAKVIFDTITNSKSNPISVQSYKKFIRGGITFTYLTESTYINLFTVIFVFKLNTMLLDLWNKQIQEDKSSEIIKQINLEIIDPVDSLRIVRILFKILSTHRSNISPYINEIISIVAHFTEKLIEIRPKSIQEKFIGFFQSDLLAQNFFKQCYDLIDFHKNKLSNHILDEFYKRKQSKFEISSKWYLIYSNLEKHIINMLKLLWSHDNDKIKNYIR